MFVCRNIKTDNEPNSAVIYRFKADLSPSKKTELKLIVFNSIAIRKSENRKEWNTKEYVLIVYNGKN